MCVYIYKYWYTYYSYTSCRVIIIRFRTHLTTMNTYLHVFLVGTLCFTTIIVATAHPDARLTVLKARRSSDSTQIWEDKIEFVRKLYERQMQGFKLLQMFALLLSVSKYIK